MRTRRRLSPPADANELLAALRAGRLLSPKRIRRIAVDWSESRPDEPADPFEGTRRRARELVDAGLLTAWQVEQILSGRARRLRLGQYRVLEWLGAGGMGSVYKAEHRLMRRVVALKILGDVKSRPVRRCRREVEAAACLSHPNVVAAYDAVRAGGVLFLVMEYVEGIDLGRLVARAGPLPVALACEATRQTALALHYAHSRGLLHCDVKPSNVLLVHPPWSCPDADALAALAGGRRPTLVKLLDMGLARQIDAAGGVEDDDLAGTPDYMAPEHGSSEPGDGRSDLYSLGCTLYHLLTGQLPFPGGDAAGKLLRHRLDVPTPVRTLRPDVPAAVAAVVERLMARDPADRPATAADAAADLAACVAGKVAEPLRGSEPLAERAAYRVAAPNRFRPSLVLAAVLCGAALVGAAWRVLPSRPEPSAAPPPAFPFVVEGRPGGYGSLAEAVAAADDNGVVTIHGAGPYTMPPLTWLGRSLTLRAAPDSRPCLETTAAIDPWQALLSTNGDLTLEGLDLRAPGGAAEGCTGNRLICVERAALRLTDCRLSAPCGAGIVYRNGAELSLQDCRVETGGAAVSVEVGDQTTCRVRIVHTVLEAREPGGAALAVWAPEVRRPTAVEVELTGDAVRADRATALTALPAGLHVTARGNDFSFRDGLLSCAGYADREGWKRNTTWDGRDNRYHGSGAWLSLDGAGTEVKGLAAWRDLWGDDETDSHEETAGAAVTPDGIGPLPRIVTIGAAARNPDRSAGER